MRNRLLGFGLLVFLVVGVEAQGPPSPEVQDLPVRRVILYKSGVGFFEHFGSVAGSTPVTIQFTTRQLDDVLKSLTAQDLDGGSIGNISYNSIAPVEQRLAGLRTPIGADADRLQLYRSLRGARVVVHAGTLEMTGRIFSVEQSPRVRSGATEQVTEITIIGADGSIRTIELTPATTVGLAERDVREDIASYLGITASARGADVRRMVMTTAGTGTRRIAISYISEVPIWKSTYRLVLPDGSRKPVLQGWAIVDNTLGQDWSNVELSLVAGAPQSFVQQISQPYYVRRPIVPLPSAVLLQPQTHAGTLTNGATGVRGVVRDTSGALLPGVVVALFDAAGQTVGEGVTDAAGNFEVSAPPGAYTLRASLPGFQTAVQSVMLSGGGGQRADMTMSVGALSESVNVSAEASVRADRLARSTGRGGGRGGLAGGVVGGLPMAAPAPAAIDYLSAVTPAAEAQDLGELFEYKLKQPVTIRKDESALVPILNTEVDAERVSLWNKGGGSGRPLRGVWLTNSSALTLDGGSFSVVDANAFAGEGLLESLKPGEKRLISYGSDLAVLVKAEPGAGSGRVLKIVARDGVLVSSREDRATWKYTARNEDTSARTLIVEHPLRPGWTMAPEPAVAETSPDAARYRVALPAKQEATLTVTERHAGDTTYRLLDIDDRTIAVLVRAGAAEATLRQVLQPLTAKRAELAAAEARLASINTQISDIDRDQQRVRENMKALRGTAEEKALTQRYTRQLDEQEDRLATLREDLKKAGADRDERRRELAGLAARLQFEIAG